MKKPTTSDQLKLVFEVVLESDAADWKRLSKSKNAQGQPVREFENKNTGKVIAVTEMEEGYFNIKGEDLEANVRLPAQFLKAAGPAKSATVIVTDPAMNAAADKAVDIIVTEQGGEGEGWTVPQSVIDTAGKALANRHIFAITQEADGSIYAMITPERYFSENGSEYDQVPPIGHLLPGAKDVAETMWYIDREDVKTPTEAAKYLQSQGFQWSRDYQDYLVDIGANGADLTAELSQRVMAIEDTAVKPSVVDQIMDIALKGKQDVPESLLRQADRAELAGRLGFRVVDEPDMGGVMAIVIPKGYDADDSKKAYDVMRFLFPEAEYIDDSVYGMWALEDADTRGKLGRILADAGMEWDADNKAGALAMKVRPAPKNKNKGSKR